MEIPDFSPFELRLIQSLWEHKTVEYISSMLERPVELTRRKIQDMALTLQPSLYQRPTFDRKISNRAVREKEWAMEQLNEKKFTPPDLSQKIAVRINAKTVVFVNSPQDIDRIKKKFQNINTY